ncbi:esterase-like activity of phytase family protein [Vallicoccus soli]|uniref:esterase-like activity of phytase family protein n=1 Tax=Vallicoccus soli TaxID=2339232 RepID=UPI001401C54D|nr:esterase-like activity of phytase family protein [Vallicoccus soli]
MTRLRTAATALALAAVFTPAALPASATATAPAGRPDPTGLELIGQEIFASGTEYRGTRVGGLSGLVRDPRTGRYLAVSDDRSSIDPARWYTLSIDLADGRLDEGDVRFRGVTTLRQPGGRPYPENGLDTEGIALLRDGRVVVTSEGDATALVDPFVGVFRRDGRRVASFPVPRSFRPTADASSGIRNNLALESAGTSPDGRWLFTATENALAQDGPAASEQAGSPSRLLRYDARTGRLDRTVVYETEPVAAPASPAGAFSTNGLVDVLPLGRDEVLAVERSFSTGAGNTIKVFRASLRGATDVTRVPSLAGHDGPVRAVRKELLLDLSTLGILLDNVEGIAWGPVLPDGRRSLVLVSDDNFSGTQFTQFLAFAVDEG